MFNKLLSGLRGRKPANPPTPDTQASSHADAQSPPELITVYNAEGQQLQISRDEWRDKVLLPHLQRAWHDADELYRQLISAINDGFLAEVEQGSLQLLAIDPVIERSHCLRGIVLLKTARLDAAEAVLQDAIKRIGKTGSLVTNLAKVEHARGNTQGADTLLEEAIQLDPNQENGLLWWLAIARERGGDSAYVAALHKAASQPGSWAPQLWLARYLLDQQNVDAAVALYREVLAQGHFGPDALTMISGDLGNHGHIALIPELVAPHYQPDQHSPQTGMNLLRAYLDLATNNPTPNNIETGMQLVQQLYALDMAPFKEGLDHFADSLQELRSRNHQHEAPSDPPTVSLIPLDKPIWHYGLRHPQWLFTDKPQDAPRVALMSFGRRTGDNNKAPGQSQQEDHLGRMSRAIPLYLAETLHYWTDYRAQALIPVIQNLGPVLFSSNGDDTHLPNSIKDNHDYLVSGDISEEQEVLHINCRLWDCREQRLIFEQAFILGQEDAQELRALEKQLLIQLGKVRSDPLDNFYQSPSVAALPVYLSQLGQSLTLTLVDNEVLTKESLWGERNMLEWALKMARHWPEALVPKIMFFSGLGKAAGYHSELLPAFKRPAFELLQSLRQQHPLASHLEPLLWKIFGMTQELEQAPLLPTASGAEHYAEWLGKLRNPSA